MARDVDWQVAEIQIRIAVLNRYTALGTPATEAIAFDHSLEPMAFMISFRPANGKNVLQPICATMPIFAINSVLPLPECSLVSVVSLTETHHFAYKNFRRKVRSGVD